MDGEKVLVKVLDKMDLNRAISMVSHAFLGANAAAGSDANVAMGALTGVALEGIAHSQFANSVAGGAAVGIGYGALAIGNLGFNLTPDKILGPELWAQVELAFLKAKAGYAADAVEETITGTEKAEIVRHRPPSGGGYAPTTEPLPHKFRGRRLR